MDVVAVRTEAEDGIAHELPGAVVGDPPTAVGVGDLDALHPVPVLAHRELVPRRAPAPRIHGRMLEQHEQVGDLAGLTGGLEAPLRPASVLIGNLSGPDGPDLVH